LGLEHDGLREVQKGLEADEWIVVDVSSGPYSLFQIPDGQICDVEKVPMPDGSSSGSQRLR
jgi:hypothetical protein